MRPNGIDDYHDYNLAMARARAEELREAYRAANHTRNHVERGVVRNVRQAAGRSLIGLGQKVFPGEAVPCR